MEPAGASSFSKESGAAFSTHTFTAGWPNFETVSFKVRFFSNVLFHHPTQTTCTWLLMHVVLRGQNQDVLRSTLWEPATPQNLNGVKTTHRPAQGIPPILWHAFPSAPEICRMSVAQGIDSSCRVSFSDRVVVLASCPCKLCFGSIGEEASGAAARASAIHGHQWFFMSGKVLHLVGT